MHGPVPAFLRRHLRSLRSHTPSITSAGTPSVARNQPKSLIAVERRMRFIAVAALLASAAAFDNEIEQTKLKKN